MIGFSLAATLVSYINYRTVVIHGMYTILALEIDDSILLVSKFLFEFLEIYSFRCWRCCRVTR